MRSQTIYFILIVSYFLSSCATQKVTVLTGVDYDESQNRTEYFVMPYGTVSIPGKWNKKHYNSVSRQQFFTNSDSVEIALAIGDNKYEFNPNGAVTGFEFVKAFYEWDANYFVESHGLNTSLIEEDSVNHYLIWRLFGDKKPGKFDTYFLIGEKKGTVSSFSITLTDKWSTPEKIKFLKELFLFRKQE